MITDVIQLLLRLFQNCLMPRSGSLAIKMPSESITTTNSTLSCTARLFDWNVRQGVLINAPLVCSPIECSGCVRLNSTMLWLALQLLSYERVPYFFVYVSLVWPDPFSPQGAYQLEIISACSDRMSNAYNFFALEIYIYRFCICWLVFWSGNL